MIRELVAASTVRQWPTLRQLDKANRAVLRHGGRIQHPTRTERRRWGRIKPVPGQSVLLAVWMSVT